ncbi:MAG: von Willebrand factor type A domain-containing protein [Planctomycetes bacterium]|nr:von Willebrand factor type A domain-containing protein [Planctomycetota bacterium]
MNADTNDFEARGTPNEGDRLHQLLCAVVLGEASADERAEVERALETSPELRAERARLEATIGLVQGSLSDGERLSPVAERELENALARRRPRPWHSRPAFRIAASVLAIGSIGWIASRVYEGRRDVRNEDVAPREQPPERDDEVARLDSVEHKELRALGYLGIDDFAPKSESTSLGFDAEAVNGAVARPAAPARSPGATAGERGEAGAGRIAPEETTALAKAKDAVDPATDRFVGFTSTTDQGRGEAEYRAFKSIEQQTAGSGSPATPGAIVVARSGGAVDVDLREFDANELAAKAVQSDERQLLGELKRDVSGDSTATSLGAGLKAGQARGGRAANEPGAGGDATRGLEKVAADDKQLPATESEKSAELGEELVRRERIEPVDLASERGSQVTVLDNSFVLVPDPKTLEARIDAILADCRRRPNERPRDMFFRFWGDNGYEYPTIDRLSTFSVDVDTASYALARNYLVSGYLPEKHAVRTEEFLNYFKGDVRPPEKATFAIETEVAPSLFGPTADALMLRVAIRGKEILKSERTPVALTFVIDVSGSMEEQNRLELVKDSLRLLVTQLDARDAVSIVVFSNDARLVLPMTSAKNRLAIEQALQPLAPESGTNTDAGLRLGYDQALAHLDANAQNRVVLLTDGVANVGVTDPAAMTARVSEQRRAGIYLNTIGVGMNNHNDTLLEQLADKGDGLCNYVDDAAEAKRALVDNFTGAFQPIARDVKVQVEFDLAQVQRYRLLGYENRAIADKDFRNDKVDAGEVGAGHQVVALYELVPGAGLGDGPLATVRLRWKDPHGEGASEEAHESAHPVTKKSVAGSYQQTSPGYRRSILVAQFAEFLRLSAHASGDSLERLLDESRELARELKDPEFDEFVALVTKSRDLIVARLAQTDPCDRRIDELRRIECLRAELEILRREGEFAAVESRRGELERELRDCLRQRIMLQQR